MQLRKLTLKDAPLMLEWMHDPSVVADLQTNFAAKTLADCQNFIRSCADPSENLHLAITDENDEYMGTVSLKHIRPGIDGEFAITVRACAMGKGFSAFGMKEILSLGLQQLGLQKIYWCVSPDNQRAVRFYDKNGYPRADVATLKPMDYTPEQIRYYIWYAVEKPEIS
ncbi:MAG: GNAT family N-acetyltransferase [Oscillospiraceae bacterium]|nr:GNAT family N-acetyltransferase [Oscillospiraceae bacterium]